MSLNSIPYGKVSYLTRFQIESNAIEDIITTRDEEIEALYTFTQLPKIFTEDLEAYVNVCQPNAYLRNDSKMPGVRVGKHIAPPSGPELMVELASLLQRVNNHQITAHFANMHFLHLHPFSDGNGRASRALWLWVKNGNWRYTFLRGFYYETLEWYDRLSGHIPVR
jgi:hypothetical protein